MRKLLILLALSLAVPSYAATGVVQFQGKVVDSTAPLTNIQTHTTTSKDGVVTTTYDVYSAPTGEKLASFSTLKDAQSFAGQVTPAVAYRSS